MPARHNDHLHENGFPKFLLAAATIDCKSSLPLQSISKYVQMRWLKLGRTDEFCLHELSKGIEHSVADLQHSNADILRIESIWNITQLDFHNQWYTFGTMIQFWHSYFFDAY
jgi:hypothetical protein